MMNLEAKHTATQELRPLSDGELDAVNGGFLPFLIAAAVVVAADVGILTWGLANQPKT
jgi:hypothetical protein